MGCVYIAHSPSGRYYVGRTTRTMARRWKDHIRDAMERGFKWPLHQAIRKYGPDSFTIEVLSDSEDIAKLDQFERAWITLLSAQLLGYNITAGGTGYRGPAWNKGIKASAELRRKFSEGAKRRMARPGERERLSSVHRGRPSGRRGHHLTEFQKEHLRKVNLGKTTPESVRQKISSALSGKPKSAEHIRKLQGINVGPKSADTRQRMSESKTGCTPWNKGLKGAQVAWNKGLRGHS